MNCQKDSYAALEAENQEVGRMIREAKNLKTSIEDLDQELVCFKIGCVEEAIRLDKAY